MWRPLIFQDKNSKGPSLCTFVGQYNIAFPTRWAVRKADPPHQQTNNAHLAFIQPCFDLPREDAGLPKADDGRCGSNRQH